MESILVLIRSTSCVMSACVTWWSHRQCYRKSSTGHCLSIKGLGISLNFLRRDSPSFAMSTTGITIHVHVQLSFKLYSHLQILSLLFTTNFLCERCQYTYMCRTVLMYALHKVHMYVFSAILEKNSTNYSLMERCSAVTSVSSSRHPLTCTLLCCN